VRGGTPFALRPSVRRTGLACGRWRKVVTPNAELNGVARMISKLPSHEPERRVIVRLQHRKERGPRIEMRDPRRAVWGLVSLLMIDATIPHTPSDRCLRSTPNRHRCDKDLANREKQRESAVASHSVAKQQYRRPRKDLMACCDIMRYNF
jgi:hypothetical protein